MKSVWLWPLLIFAALAPLSVAAGNIGTGLILLVAILALLQPKRPAASWLPRRVLTALLIVLAWNAVSTFAADPGTRHWYKLFEEWWMKLLILAVPVLLVGAARNLRRLLMVILFSGTFIASYGLIQHYYGQDLVRHHPLLTTGGKYLIVGFTGHHLSFGGQLMILLPMALALTLANFGRNSRLFWLAATALFIMGLALVWTYARSSLLAVAAAAMFLVLLQTGRTRKMGLAFLLVGVVGAAAMPSVRGRMLETFTNPKEVTRLNLWRSSVAGIEAHPLTGWGPGNFGKMLEEYEYPGFYEARGHAHNDLLMQAVNAGLPGTLVFLWFYGEVFFLLWRGWRVQNQDSWIITGAMATLVSVLVGGVFQVYQTDDEPEMLLYFLLGCGLAAALQALKSVEAADESCQPPS